MTPCRLLAILALTASVTGALHAQPPGETSDADRRGHGESSDPLTGYSETAHAEDLAALMRHFGMREAHFVVNSRGGAIIIQFLNLYQDRVRSITFADATISLAPISDQSAFAPVVPRLKAPPPTLEQALPAAKAPRNHRSPASPSRARKRAPSSTGCSTSTARAWR